MNLQKAVMKHFGYKLGRGGELLPDYSYSELKLADPNEPVFILRAQDIRSAEAIEAWLALYRDELPAEKRVEAHLAIAEILEWQAKARTRSHNQPRKAD